MAHNVESETLSVAAGDSLLLEHASQVEVTCRSGCVWITQYGDDRDVVLKAGDAFCLDLPTATVMSSSRGAELLLVRRRALRRSGWATRLARLLDPRWSGRVGDALGNRVRRHRVLQG